MLKMRFGLPEVAGSSEPEAAYGLRDRGLNTGSERVEAEELGRLLSLSRCLQGDVCVACPERHEAPRGNRTGAIGAVRTSSAVLCREFHLDDRRATVVQRRASA